MTNLFETLVAVKGDEPSKPRNLAIYRAVVDPKVFGVDDDGTFVCGMRLEAVFADGYDMLAEEFQNCGVEATMRIHLPKEGLQPGQLYTPRMTNVSHDYESGHVDDWDIELVPYDGEIPTEHTEIKEAPDA